MLRKGGRFWGEKKEQTGVVGISFADVWLVGFLVDFCLLVQFVELTFFFSCVALLFHQCTSFASPTPTAVAVGRWGKLWAS